MLGPLAVEPTLEGNNIGGALICETIRLAKEAGIAGLILCGEPGYYPKFGFKLMQDLGKIEDPVALEKISKEFPAYRKVKVQEGFMQIFNQHLGLVESVDGDVFKVRYWELIIPCRLTQGLEQMPTPGSDVQFIWNHKGGESKITKVIKNLLDD